jgi:hypothetical protein
MDARVAPEGSTDASALDAPTVGDATTDTATSTGPGDASVPDAPAGDTASVTAPDALSAADSGCGACALTAPPSWSLVAFAPSTAAPCPAGFTTTDVVENATPGTACSCGTGCQATADCTQIQIPTSAGNGCADNATPVNPASGSCIDDNSFFIGPQCGVGSVQLSVPTSQCVAAAPSQDLTGIVAQHDRICQPAPAVCPSVACAPSVAPKFTPCIMAAGDQQCPSTAATKHAVGAPSLDCGTCSCTATVQCAGTLTFYPAGGCNGSPVPIAMGACVPVVTNQTIGSYQWTASPSPPPTCAVGPPSASVTLTNPATVCCP